MIYLDKEQSFLKNLIEQYRILLRKDQRNLGEAIASCKDHVVIKVVSSAMCDICAKSFGWWCPDSEDNICEYDAVKDPNYDFCLHCGRPDERK